MSQTDRTVEQAVEQAQPAPLRIALLGCGVVGSAVARLLTENAGDLLAVPVTGAYCRSLSSQYNHLPRPPVVAVTRGVAREIVRRETIEDLLSLDVD